MTPRERAQELFTGLQSDCGYGTVLSDEWLADIEEAIRDAVEESRQSSAVAGKEAEELRAGIETALTLYDPGDVEWTLDNAKEGLESFTQLRADLRYLLDDVNARDSLTYLEVEDEVLDLLAKKVSTITVAQILALKGGGLRNG